MKKNFEEKDEKRVEREEMYDTSDIGDAGRLDISTPSTKQDEKGEGDEEQKEEKSGSETDGDSEKSCQKKKIKFDVEEDEGDDITEKDTAEEEEEEEEEAHSEKGGPEMAVELIQIAIDLISGKTTAENIAGLMNAAKAKTAIEEARRQGEIAGRNAAIEDRLRCIEPGVPNLCGGGAGKVVENSIFDIAAIAR